MAAKFVASFEIRTGSLAVHFVRVGFGVSRADSNASGNTAETRVPEPTPLSVYPSCNSISKAVSTVLRDTANSLAKLRDDGNRRRSQPPGKDSAAHLLIQLPVGRLASVPINGQGQQRRL